MRSKLLSETQHERRFVLVFDTGDDMLPELTGFAKRETLSAAIFSAVGACERVTLGFFDPKKKDYEKIPVDEQVEVMSLMGNIAIFEGEPRIHAHIVVGKRDGTAHGGHLIAAIVRPTLELFLTELPQTMTRSMDKAANLPLIDLKK